MFKSKHSGYIAGCRVLPMGGDKKQSTQTSTSVADYSQVNTTSTNINDLSNRSTNYDASTTITNTNITDGGAISGIAGVAMDAGKNALDQVKQAFGLASTVVTGANAAQVHAYDYADSLFSGALEAVTDSQSRAYNAWDRASMMQEGAAKQLQSAYADAKGTTQSQQQIMLAVVAVAGVAVLASARARS
jgi:hypothetical protein